MAQVHGLVSRPREETASVPLHEQGKDQAARSNGSHPRSLYLDFFFPLGGCSAPKSSSRKELACVIPRLKSLRRHPTAWGQGSVQILVLITHQL